MINRKSLLTDLQKLLKRLEADLLERSDSAEVPDVKTRLKAEYERAKKANRTGQNYEAWRTDAITQAAAAWVLSAVFVRFLEDNRLIDPPKISGRGERLQRARDEHEIYFREHPKQTDRDYLLAIFDQLAALPGTADVFGGHNPIRELPNWLSGDAAGELLRFFQKIDANTGELLHDFTDPNWDTRFLGDVYQDLSEAARKKYALLQTPDFVEEFILDRTLEPALEEFGLDAAPVLDSSGNPLTAAGFRMIDPACGSGHFLLGAFRRILDRWQRKEPGTNVRELVQHTLNSIFGVDINPYAVAIARFRLLLAAMRACDVTRLADAPGFQLNLACGDSLLHAPLRGGQQVLDFELTNGDDECEHAYQSEDLPVLKRLLRGGQYHAVVANPPYIRPSDAGLNAAYRKRFISCHGFYALTSPFMETIYGLSIADGFTGQITGNSYMNNEFGKALVEKFLPRVEITTIVDTKYITPEGHGTPTVILFGRRRQPILTSVRSVVGLKGDRNSESHDAFERIWKAMLGQVDLLGSVSEFFQTLEIPREALNSHPWPISCSEASDITALMESVRGQKLSKIASEVGVVGMTNADDVLLAPKAAFHRRCIESVMVRRLVAGDNIRDWQNSEDEYSLFPYQHGELVTLDEYPRLLRWLWSSRTVLGSRATFGNSTYAEEGRPWWGWHQISHSRLENPVSVVFAYKATHNHFMLTNGSDVFNRTAPVVKVPEHGVTDTLLGVLGLLNCSLACFWERTVHRQVSGAGNEPWETRSERNITKIKDFYVPNVSPVTITKQLVHAAEKLKVVRPGNWVESSLGEKDASNRLSTILSGFREKHNSTVGEMIRLQEELDWECYHLYGLIEKKLTQREPPPLKLGERAFEIVLARKMAVGETQTTWFKRHGSTPITEMPAEWPEDYRLLVERRIELIENDPNIRLIEQPEYKRRWNTEPWESQLHRALRDWLLARLESYFDFDGRMNDAGRPTALLDVAMVSVAKLADLARQDAEFQQVGELYRDDPAFDVQALVAELVAAESVPLLPVLRYKPSGLIKRGTWERCWELQRQEDAIDARTKLSSADPRYLTEAQARDLKRQQVGDIPVPTKYDSKDFLGNDFWRLRGKLDVPKERWISFPYCDGADGTPVICWAGYDHLQQARAISAYFVEIQEQVGGREDSRLIPLLACLLELLPWLKQWHNEVDPEFGMPMGDYFEGFISEEARQLGKSIPEIKAWAPPARAATRRGRRAKA